MTTVEAGEYAMPLGVPKGPLDDLTAFSVACFDRVAIHLGSLSIDQFLTLKTFDRSATISILHATRGYPSTNRLLGSTMN